MSEVAKSGPVDTPGASGRAAVTRGPKDGGERRRRRAGERPVPADSYYGRPIVKEPTWQALDIAGYFFLGGLAGASSVVAAGAELSGRSQMARTSKRGATCAIGMSVYFLIHDLGKPSRFYNMLRVLKLTSPMSVGSWLLGAYAPCVGLAGLSTMVELPRGVGRGATIGAGLIGPAVASYTAVLAANTAIPAWHDAHRELPFVFVSSAAAAASGLALIGSPVRSASPARRLAALAAVGELVAEHRMEQSVGLAAECYRKGRAGTLMNLSKALTLGGAACALAFGRRSRAGAVVGGLALMGGSACTRFAVFEAGKASARDPKYVLAAQR